MRLSRRGGMAARFIDDPVMVWIAVWIEGCISRHSRIEIPADRAVRPMKYGLTTESPFPVYSPEKREVGYVARRRDLRAATSSSRKAWSR